MPSPRSLSASNLEQLKRQAKDLVKAVRAGDPSAMARLRAVVTKPVAQDAIQLAHAQLVIARELGFPSWPQLKEEFELQALALPDLVERFLLAVTDPVWHARARRIHTRSNKIAAFDIATAATLGRVDRVREILGRDSRAATSPVGPRKVPPLVYAAFSRFHAESAETADGILACARLLLDAGADPNAKLDDRGEDVALLYGAVAANNHRLVSLLLDAGAIPNDGESLYHATEHRDHKCLEAILAKGATITGTNALFRMLDFEDTVGLAMLLNAGADVNETLAMTRVPGVTPLHHAIRRGRSPAVLALLVDRGAALEARDADGCTPYALAKRLGHDEAAEYLASCGASREVSAVDEFLSACARGDLARARAIADASPGLIGGMSATSKAALAEAAIRGDLKAVQTILDVGMDVDAPGEMGMTALHSAAWWGNAAMVDLLLSRKASVTHINEYGGTALANAVHGSIHCPGTDGEYGLVAERLIAAGSAAGEWMLEGGSDEVADVVRKHLAT